MEINCICGQIVKDDLRCSSCGIEYTEYTFGKIGYDYFKEKK